jgi:hypothetical protein
MSSSWVTVAHLPSQQEYLLARGRLESAGIECFSPNENTARLAGAMLLFSGEYQFILQVRPEQADDARELLADPGSPFLVSE